jgi:hypothetical protein
MFFMETFCSMELGPEQAVHVFSIGDDTAGIAVRMPGSGAAMRLRLYEGGGAFLPAESGKWRELLETMRREIANPKPAS